MLRVLGKISNYNFAEIFKHFAQFFKYSIFRVEICVWNIDKTFGAATLAIRQCCSVWETKGGTWYTLGVQNEKGIRVKGEQREWSND